MTRFARRGATLRVPPPPTCVQTASASIVAWAAAYRNGGQLPLFDVIIANAAVTLPPPPPMHAAVQAIGELGRQTTAQWLRDLFTK